MTLRPRDPMNNIFGEKFNNCIELTDNKLSNKRWTLGKTKAGNMTSVQDHYE